MKNLKKIFACLFVLVSFVSCGYQFEGGGYIKDDVTLVAVKAFDNQSSESGAGIKFTNALIQEILQKTNTKVVDVSRASAVLTGTIKTITFSTLSRSSVETVVDRRIFATVDVNLVDKNDEVIWSVKDFTTYEDYTVSSDKITDTNSRKEAGDKIALRMAEQLVSKLQVNF